VIPVHAAWLEAHQEWGPGVHGDGFGLRPSDEVDSPAGFAAWVARLAAQLDPAKPVDAGRVHCTYRWIVEGDRVLGGIARHPRSRKTTVAKSAPTSAIPMGT
jgi:predicted acetyltransferase